MTTTVRKPVPIFTSAGDFDAFLIYPFIYSRNGEWIGYITPEKDIYSVLGEYVGWLSDDPRILRKRTSEPRPALTPPPPPRKMNTPSGMPLAPMMSDLNFDTIDVLQDDPARLHTLDVAGNKPDMD